MPQNFYELVWIFIIYAFIGWCTEVSYAALDTGKFVNIQLHQFLYDDTEYEPTDTVKSNSEKIISDTGFHQGDGY